MISVYLQSLILNYTLFGNAFSLPGFYLALFVQDPANGTSGELSVAEYSRQSITFDSNYKNTNTIMFGPATTDWGMVNYVVLTDSAAKATGNVLLSTNIGPTPIGIATSIVIEPGTYTIS